METLLGIQCGYYLLTGIWPLVHVKSFMKVTGYKTDIWLLKTVGALVSVLALIMLAGIWEPALVVIICATCSAFVFICIDTYYVLKKTISPIYLVDAAIQIILLAIWIGVLV